MIVKIRPIAISQHLVYWKIAAGQLGMFSKRIKLCTFLGFHSLAVILGLANRGLGESAGWISFQSVSTCF